MSPASRLALRAASPTHSDAAEGTLLSRLDALAEARPDMPALRDPAGRESWSGRPASRLGAREAAAEARRLAGRFASLGLPRGTTIGLALPGGSEATLVLVAIESAGFRPCPLPLHLDPAGIDPILDATGIAAIVTQTRVGDLSPADAVCRLAASRFRLRFVLGYGPDIPDGMIDLEARPGAAAGPSRGSESPAGIVTVATAAEGVRAFARSTASLAAAATPIARAAGIRPGDIVAGTLVPDDLRGLAAGPILALVAGAAFEGHGLFDPTALRTWSPEGRTHLVLPGWAEPLARAFGLDRRAASIILVHDAGSAWPDPAVGGRAGPPIVDVVAFGEMALASAARDRTGRCALHRAGGGDVSAVAWAAIAGGAFAVRGAGADAVPLGPEGSPLPLSDAAEWRASDTGSPSTGS